ncbi:MAG: sulfatase-like hydrolase/transferase [Solirubrobacterales bacterium]|nr:sulfatase-like hydrolase/transferase [Solirubrobacterales bacterium]
MTSGLAAAAAFATALLAAVAMAGCGGGGNEPNPPVQPSPRFDAQPNVILVLTDDQDLAAYNRRTMPDTVRLLADRGTTFSRYVDATPLCCPARAALVTGQYGHNNGVLNNIPGYETLRDKDNIVSTWLDRAGYETAYIGKYMNGYERVVGDNKTPGPGWDRWFGMVGKHSFYDFKLAVGGERRKRHYEGQYLTDVLNRLAAEQVSDLSRADDPFYLQFSQLAPHVENGDSGGPCGTDAVPAKRDLHRFQNATLPNMPAVRETDVSDKPSFIRSLPRIGAHKLKVIRARYICRLQSLRAVDRGMKMIVDALREAGELDDTVIIYTSDNGTFQGQHGLPGGKGLPYEEAARLPLVMRVPPAFRGGGRAVARSDAPVASIDVVPTIVDWAGAETCPESGDCRVMDGRSLVPVLEGRRDAIGSDRPILTEFDVGKDEIQPGRGIACAYRGVYAGRWLYVNHSSVPDPRTGRCMDADESELYDLVRDPFELENAASPSGGARAGAVQERLAAITERLADCAGIEGRDPEPASGHYCGAEAGAGR